MSPMTEPSEQRGTLLVYNTLDELVRAGADAFVREAAAARPRGVFRVPLSGGSTPKPMYELLAAAPRRDAVDWSQVQFYWGDERNVGPESPESNYHMARQALLDKIPVRPEQVHRIEGELVASEAAMDYQRVLQQTFGLAPASSGEFPRFDLILLGMGPDGHTASLFPNTMALEVRNRTVVANAVPKLQTERITLTVPTINNAAAVLFLIAGADKADALAAVLQGPEAPMQYPSQLIAPQSGSLTWMVDTAAAAKLALA